jgi:molybdopterin-guanine dinucleotide biosynthesis protein B
MEEKLPPVISIVSRSGAGKTVLIERLIAELRRRGYRVGTVKHHVHPGFEIDHRGKDSWRHAQAGSDHVVIAAPDKVASIRKVEREFSLEEIIASMNDVDIIFTEGYRREGVNKIEVVRSALNPLPLCKAEELLAIVSDRDPLFDLPYFGLDETKELADFIQQRFLKDTHRKKSDYGE